MQPLLRNLLTRLCILLGIFLTGCAASTGGFPHRSEDERADLQALENTYKSADRISNHHSMPADQKREDRNDFVTGRMAMIDANYKMFVRDFVVEKEKGDTGTDVAVIGLTTAGALLTPTGTTRILSGIAGGITGSKASYDKNFYYEQTTKALFAAMNAQRKAVRARILTGLKEEETAYPLTQALGDLDDYYFAGTFLGGLQAIQSDAGEKDARVQTALDDLITQPTSQERHDTTQAISGAINIDNLKKLTPEQREALAKSLDSKATSEQWSSPESLRVFLVEYQRKNRRPKWNDDALQRLYDQLKTYKVIN
jgi:hypothetical protein